ncbi:MAG: RluA family pseudouridine synthase [Thermodesulfovibrionales bacterium]|nr:RluA family pseudouridine synthase [Thermodesulfovibrionales bacterium]
MKVQEQDSGKRIDVLAVEETGITRSQIQRLIKRGFLLVDSRTVSQNYRVKAGDVIVLTAEDEKREHLIAEAIPIEILYMDEHLVVVNKPSGMVVYPAAGHSSGTLMNVLLYHCKKLEAPGGPLRPGIVHRLDKDTSGVMAVALDSAAYYNLAEQFKQRTINRRYVALIYGNPKENGGQISLAIGRSETDRKKMSTRVRRGKEALTIWKVIERFRHAAFIEAKLRTGRTHQIRVHFASIGHPVLGDRAYGKKIEMETKESRRLDSTRGKLTFPRQMLHAESLGFIHPVTGEYLEFHSPMPEDMEDCISKLRSS